MKKSGGIAALAVVLLLVCAGVAWEWYAHLRANTDAPQPLQQISADSPAPQAPPSPSPSPSPLPATAAPSPRASTAPRQAAPSPQPAPSSALQPSAAPSPTPSPTPAVRVMVSPDAQPRILSMSISTPVAHGGELVSGTVRTTSNVASVVANIAGFASPMQKVGVGRFVLSYRVPNLPFFLHRTYTIEVTARNTRGDAATGSVPITIR